MTERINRQLVLKSRPQGMVSPDNFDLIETPVPSPEAGEVLVRNLLLSCDPTQRGWMSIDTYLPAVRIGEVMRAGAAAEVVESNHESFQRGQLVQGMFGWQDYCLARPGTATAPTPLIPGVSPEVALSVLGLNGLTAYFGLIEIGRPKQGETVVVSAAAGATGSAAGQIAKALGCRVVGLAGGPDKCRRVLELGFDAAIDYKGEDVPARLRELCPNGIDVYFDNVGGPILDAVLARLALAGRIVLCGGISVYNNDRPTPGPSNYLTLVSRRGRMEGFIVLDYLPRAAEAIPVLMGWMAEGKLKHEIDLVEGLENAPAALARLFKGENHGKQLVKIADAGAG